MRRFEVFRRGSGWKWRLFADNGRVLAESVPVYRNHRDCRAAIVLVMSTNASTVVVDEFDTTDEGQMARAALDSRR